MSIHHNEGPVTRKKFKDVPEPGQKIILYRKDELVTSYSEDGKVTFTDKDSSGVFIVDPQGNKHYAPNTGNDLEWEPTDWI